MKNTITYTKFHLSCLLKNWFYYVFIFIAYFYLAFRNDILLRKTGTILVTKNTVLEWVFIPQQYTVCYYLIIMVSMIIYDNFFKIYQNYFRIYIQKPMLFFHTMVGVTILSNVVPCIIGKMLFIVYNYSQTGYWAIHWQLDLVFLLEIAALSFFGIALYLFFQKIVLVVLTYFIALYITTSYNNIFFTIPLFYSVISKHFNPFTLDLWGGRILLLSVSILLYILSLKLFFKKRIAIRE